METKTCNVCGEWKPLLEFSKCGQGERRRGTCNSCRSTQSLKYRSKPEVRERIRNRGAVYEAENRVKISKRKAAYYLDNKERLLETKRQYREKNKKWYNAYANARKKKLSKYGFDNLFTVQEEARRLTRETGVLHHADHVQPAAGLLKEFPENQFGDLWQRVVNEKDNLQVLTQKDNDSKGSKYNRDELVAWVRSKNPEVYELRGNYRT